MKVVDLSHSLYQGMPNYPTDPPILIKKRKDLDLDRSVLHEISFGTHCGTHLDVPMHTLKNGKGLMDYGLDAFFGKAIKVNNTKINFPFIKENSIGVLIYETGWYKNYNDPEIYFGGNRPSIPINMLKGCVESGISIFGCDLPSVDKSGCKEKNNHKILLENDIIIYESLNNLSKINIYEPFRFYGFPLAFNNLDGCPVRAVGIVD